MFPNKKIGTKEEFWNYLQQRRKEESMLGCARKDETVEGQVIIDGEPTGILSRHAYGLLDVFTIESQENGEEFKLLRIRNPWGKTEWVGDWSDNSEEIEKYRKELDVYVEELEDDEKFEIGEEDGTFIINFEDWSTIYNKLYVTIDFPPSWTGFRFTDSWNKGNSGGLPMPSAGITAKDAQISWGKNPQYLINQNKNGTVEFFFSLAQNDGRIEGKYIFPFVEIIDPICLIIYPAEDGKAVSKFDGSKVNPAWISTVVEHKEVSLRAMLPKGKYIVVPSQRQPSSDERPYYLSIYFNGSIGEVSFKNLKNPGNNGEEIKEEDEEIEVSQLRQDIIKTRLEDIYDSNVERKKPKIFN
uniref:Calpain catalytic domain-containing protein n=1 Tax=Euplotes crassus TaxID=5936 RepID=A0A7S3KEW9_EUPCR|mmetsp:Transcript_22117/g.21898  ORF Transcript_22117/g.21898 Transcript_22117/m.21898 type:complete len:356 (+) Transcript_22117:1467-2534(+)